MSTATRVPYSPVRHLAYLIWPNHDPARCFMAVFNAYFDASGDAAAKGKAQALVVAGFVATIKKWQKFERAWPALLEEYNIPSPLHMTDFMAIKGRYKSWSGDAATQESFRLAAVAVLKRHTNKPFVAAVTIPDLHRMFDEYEIPEPVPRQPFAFCALLACDGLFGWAQNRFRAGTVHGSDDVEILFETGDLHRGAFSDALWAKHKKDVNFRTNKAKALVPLEACDFLAWEFRNFAKAHVHGMFLRDEAERETSATEKRRLRLLAIDYLKPNPVVAELIKQLPSDSFGYADWKVLQRICERRGWPKRER